MAITSVSALADIKIVFNEIYSNGVNNPVNLPSEFRELLEYANGSSAGQVNLCVLITESGKAASGNTDYDLRALADDGTKGTVSFSAIHLIAFKNKRTTASALLLLGPKDGTNGVGIKDAPTAGLGFWNAGTERIVVPQGGFVILQSDTAIPVNATYKDLRVSTSAVSGDTNSWDLMILGRS